MTVDVNKQLDRAKRFLEKNKVEDAIEAYQSILNEIPGHLESLQAMGDLYTRMNQIDRAIGFQGALFDRLCEAHEDNKAAAVYARTLKSVQQPAERMVRYALLLQKQNRVEEAIEQFAQASELFLARGRGDAALDCLDRLANLDPGNAGRQFAAGELAARLGNNAMATRYFMRAAQLAETSGDVDAALNLLARAHQLAPGERTPALLYAQALLRRGDGAGAVALLESLPADGADAAFLGTLGEALMMGGLLDRAREVLQRLPADQPTTTAKLFDLTRLYLAAQRDADAVKVLRELQRVMVAARQGGQFATQIDGLAESYANSLGLTEFCASAYADLNREARYFDSVARLFDMYLDGGNVAGASGALEKLIEIDPYDSRNLARVERLESRASASTVSQIRARLSQVATHSPQPAAETAAQAASAPAAAPHEGKQGLEDLMVQAEIFIQYSLQPKAVERLQEIAREFPGEEDHNERLRNLYQLANWWPSGSRSDPMRKAGGGAEAQGRAGGAGAAEIDSASTMRDLAKVSEISQSLFRLPSARAILSAGINEIGTYLRATRCLAAIGPAGRPPQIASEFSVSGMEPTPGVLLVRLLGEFERAAPDALGGLPLDAAAAPVLRELGLTTALAVVLTDRETQTQAGMVVVAYSGAHTWRANETYFLQAVGDQMLLSVNHTRLRALARNLGAADEKTGLLARSSYQDCLLSETQRAKSQGTPLALALLQVDGGRELLRDRGEASLERLMERVARALGAVVRHGDIGVKYTGWAIAFILPDTALAGAQSLAGKLLKAGMEARAPGETEELSLSASVAEAVTRADYDSEDIVTELINRAEAGLEDAKTRGGNTMVSMSLLAE